jgi:hypothetical protein
MSGFFGLAIPKDNSTQSGGLRIGPDGCVLPSPAAAARLAKIKTLDEDSCMSFDEWKLARYWIKKGEKSYFTDALGVPQFTKEQVTKSRW